MTLAFVGAASLPFLVSAQDNTTSTKPNRAAFQSALDSGDYAAFTATRPAGAPEISEEIFQKLVEANKLRKAGDKTGADKIMTELGLKKPEHDRMKGFFQNLTDEQKEVLKQAKALNDAGKEDEAKALLSNAGIKVPEHKGPFTGEADQRFANLTDAQKTAMKEARTLIKEGKMEEAKQILDAAGIQRPTHPTTQSN